MSIEPLPEDVVAQIKSSIIITSLNGVIRELFKNSLDAGASRIDLTIDYNRGGCVVEDDGFGISPDEFGERGGLGKLYHSSKWNSQTTVHGGRGIFLASLSAMALVTVTSHHHEHRSHNTAVLHQWKVISRQLPSPLQQHLTSFSHGSRVTVNDLFGNMPVRVKQRALSIDQRGVVKEWGDLRHGLVGLLLPWKSNITVNIREAGGQKLRIRAPLDYPVAGNVVIPRICDILCQANYMTPDEKESWVAVGATTGLVDLIGTISLDPSPVKSVQFMSFGVKPILQIEGPSMFHEEVNRLFSSSAFGNIEEADELGETERLRRSRDARCNTDGFTNKELKGAKKGVDRWPRFFITIILKSSENAPNRRNVNVEEVCERQGSTLDTITELLRTMIWEFLKANHFRPKHIVGRRSKADMTDKEHTAVLPGVGNWARNGARSHQKPVTKSILRRQTTSFDPLGVNVRMPSFRQVVTLPESPFDSWSKVKSGNAIVRSVTPKLILNSARQPSPIPRPSTVPPASTAKLPAQDIPPRSQTPDAPRSRLVSKNGKIVRRPFEDVDLPVSRRKPSTPSLLTPVLTPQVIPDEDLVLWMNPITKMRSVVSTRTGHTILANSSAPALRVSADKITKPQHSATIQLQSNSPAPWIRDLLKTWDNPVFQPTEQNIPQASIDGVDISTQDILHGRHHSCPFLDIDKAFKETAAGMNGRISKTALKNAVIISQIDKKFILVKLQLDNGSSMLVIIDQHAADERIRIESLLEELCSPPRPGIHTKSVINTQVLEKALVFEISAKDAQLLRRYSSHFLNWGIFYDAPSLLATGSKTQYRLTVQSLPPSIIERCKLDPRLLIDLIRTEVWKLHEKGTLPTTLSTMAKSVEWIERITSCPQGVLDMLNSRACRSAIMFNDVLTIDQCQELVRRLANCKFPFQCAHGRPSLVPLVDLESFGGKGKSHGNSEAKQWDEGGSRGFGQSFKMWRDRMDI